MDEGRSRKAADLGGGGVRGITRAAARSNGTSSSAARRLGGRSDRAKREAPHPPQFGSSALADAALATLEKLNRGVLLLDASGAVQFMNGPARAMLNRGHGLSIRKQRLAFAGAAEEAALEACLERATGSLLLRIVGPNHAHRPYSVLVSPLKLADEPAGFAVFIHEPLGKQRPVPTQVLRGLYGLTVAEARLVNALYVGQSLQLAAGTGGISHNTAKSTLKRVFEKCAVASQAELLQLLSLGPRTV